MAFDATWIYHKNSVILKVMELFGEVHRRLEEHAVNQTFVFPEGCLQRGGKISKGERYKELPYVILDYPRHFSQQEIFAFRTMFWWGHYFICTLHLAGAIKEEYEEALSDGQEALAAAGFAVYVREDPWEHDFENGNYRAVATFTSREWAECVKADTFIKLAKPFALEMWEKVIPAAADCYGTLLTVLRG